MSKTEQHIHHSLIEKAKKNDRQAQSQLYQFYFKTIYNSSLRIVKDAYVAEDMMQDAFLEAFKNLKQLKDNVTFGNWLKRIAINRSINFINRAGRVEEQLKDTLTDEQVEVNIDAEVLEIKNALTEIGRTYELVFNLYYLEGYDHEEIASILNIAASTSRSQLTRAKQKIRTVIQKNRKQYAMG